METLMTHIQPFFGWLLNATLVGSLVVCLILLIQKTLGGRLGPRWCHALWLVLVVRMVLPWAPSSRWSLSNLIPPWDRQTQPEQQSATVEQQKPSETAQTSGAVEAMTPQKPRPDVIVQEPATAKPVTLAKQQSISQQRLASLRHVLPILWLAGAIVIGFYLLVSDLALWRIVKRDRPLVNQPTLELFEECKAQMGVQSLVVVVPSDQVRSPGLFGFIRPRLLLPREMLDTATRQELRYVFLHELAHLKRHDIYLGWLTGLLQVLHWFNPLVWFAFYRMRADRELACDALVLTRTGQDKSQEYGGAILGLVRRFSRSRPLPAMAGIMESRSQLKRRIAMITQFRNNSYRWSPLAAVLIVILACVCLPDAKRARASAISAVKPPPMVIRQVWAGAADPYFMGAPSADGKYLSYVDWRTGDLGVRDLATGTNRKLTSEGWEKGWAQHSVFSPDSKQLAYYWWNNKKGEEGGAELRIVGLDGSGPRVVPLDEGTYLRMPAAWSADGKQILALGSAEDRSVQILLIPVADGKMRVLKTLPLHPWLWRYPSIRRKVGMSLSPDGRYVAYTYPAKQDSPECDIFLLAVDGSGETALVEHPADDFLLGWAPDGRGVVFASDRTGNMGIWGIEVTNGKPQGTPHLLKPEIGEFHPMGFMPNGSYYYGVVSMGSNVYVASYDPQKGNVSGEPVLAIKQYEGSNRAPDWSPDGRYLACVSERPGAGRVFLIHSVETGQVRELSPDLEEFDGNSLRWFPDGRSLLGAGRAKDSPPGGILKIDVETGKVSTIAQGGQFPNVTSDGKTMFDVSRGHNGWWIWRHDLTTGEKEPVFRAKVGEHGVGAILGLALSPDGKQLAFQDLDAGVLKVISVEGGQPRELVKFDGKATIAWAPDGSHLLYANRLTTVRPGGIWRISADGGEPQKLDLKMGYVNHVHFHPDGRQITFTARTKAESKIEVWAMENFLPATAVARPQPVTTLRKLSESWSGFANISPDGRYLCDIDWNDGNLTICDLVTGKRWPVTENTPGEAISRYALEAAISPDSEKVAYLWYEEKTGTSSLWLVGRDGSDRRLLCEGKYIMPKDWSADGSKTLAAVNGRPHQMVWVSASDGSIQKIKDLSNEYPGKSDVSPDGRFIAYDLPQADDTPKRDVFLYDIAENRDIHLIETPADDMLLGWTPDGKSIFFSSDRTGTWDGWLLDVRDGKPAGIPQRVKKGMGKVESVGFRSNGDYYFGVYDIRRSVFTASFDPDTCSISLPPNVVRQTGSQNSPDWSPDGKYLAYFDIEKDNDNPVICIRSVATGQEREIDPKLAHVANLIWAPDGRSLLVTGSAERNRWNLMIYQIDAQTGKRTELVRSEHERLMAAEWLPDGKRLLYSRFTGSDGTTAPRTVSLVIRDIDTGNEKDLVRVERPDWIRSGALSPDGRHLAVETTSGGITLVSVDGGQTRELLGPDQAEKNRIVACWSPDGRYIFLLVCPQMSPKPTRTELWRIAAAGGQPEKLQTFRQLPLVRMQIHPSGRQVALCTHEGLYEMWVMENFLPGEMGK